MSAANRSSFVYVTYIRTTPEKLWEALTDPQVIRQQRGKSPSRTPSTTSFASAMPSARGNEREQLASWLVTPPSAIPGLAPGVSRAYLAPLCTSMLLAPPPETVSCPSNTDWRWL